MYSYLSGVIKRTIARPALKDLMKTGAYADLAFMLLDAEEEEDEEEKPKPAPKPKPRKASKKSQPARKKPQAPPTSDESDDLDEEVLEDIYNQLKSFEARINRLQEIECECADDAPATLAAITERMGTLAAKMDAMESEEPHTCIV